MDFVMICAIMETPNAGEGPGLRLSTGKDDFNMALSASAPWVNFYGNTPKSIDYPSKTMYQLLSDTARRYPQNIAYVFMGKETDYATFLRRVDLAAKAFVAMGIHRGDRVTICMPNSPQGVDCFYALNRIGAIPNMIHPLSAEKEINLLATTEQSTIASISFFSAARCEAKSNICFEDTSCISQTRSEYCVQSVA